MVNLVGRWALVTGASRGLGKLIALEMAKRGCNLVLHSRSIEHTREVIEAVRSLGVKAQAVEADLADPAAVSAMLDAIEALPGVKIDVVFNNAALQGYFYQKWHSAPPEEYNRLFQINVTAPIMICYRFLPGMISRGFGRIINTTSGINNLPELGAYAASKAALDKFTRDVGSKLESSGKDVVISLADPGWCRTDLGGPQAPNSPESALPGLIVGAFVSGKSGRLFEAQRYAGKTLEQAVASVR